ncbi:pirin family protein [Peptoniphilus indolicus]|uniref:Short-chain dehydrogenase/reductase family oxidoreductase n=3 Tax=Peptoniphilus TaxID=162289 RepID=G4D2H9_9FIRM|nr:pirin family protein [Peptoniphilus indolicus]EGY80256.1 short-chain dehydrogenase/reductase family oxidoreductase [Peptoniphilus indolicus ATCC 29427]SUB75308.1 Quercetin 2,3-dioxygenase [Peptoniphilus indolicus]
MNREVVKKVTGFRTKDGAGVSLVRVLGHETTDTYDPILMLDSFDSTDPDDYTAGFPMHPHRGIETISYVYRGNMVHKDSLGNEDQISDGEVQWMTAGSGIMHEEVLPASERMLGVQLWLNLPKKDKMVRPEYHAIKNKDIEEIKIDGGYLRLLAGNYKDHKGHVGKYLPLDYYDIHIEPGKEVSIDTADNKSVTVFTLIGDVEIENKVVEEKTSAKLGEGNKVVIKNHGQEEALVLFLSSEQLNEPIAWGGPIVMNTRRELEQAFADLQNGNFIKDKLIFDRGE